MVSLSKMMKWNHRYVTQIGMIIAVLGHLSPVEAQISQGGRPYSFSSAVTDSIATRIMAALDVAALVAEDELEAAQDSPVPPRFGYAFSVSLGLDNAGTWTELPNGDRLWRLSLVAPGAYSINLLYDEFWLPEGARFFIYNEDRSMVLGAFTSANNKDYGKFSTGLVRGDISILEYYEPASARPSARLHISRVVHGYRNIIGPTAVAGLGKGFTHGPLGFGASGACNSNINCPAGVPWADEKRSVVMILLDDGTRLASGAIINNTRLDYTPYLLLAFHSIDTSPEDGILSAAEIQDAEQWMVMFNYESPNCTDIDGPITQTVSGTTLKAGNVVTDFALLELSTTPPSTYDVYYAGWSTDAAAATSVTGIHHPHGDIKKIALDNEPPQTATHPDLAPNSHWYVEDWDSGTTETGSSGSPLFNQSHQIVGQVHAGNGYAACHPLKGTYYGKFSVSWDYGSTAATRLRDWLDPDNTLAKTLGGMEGPPRLENISLLNQSLQKAKVYAAGGSVSAGTGVTVTVSGDVMFVAGGYAGGNVTLSPGFHAQAGSKFRAYIDPSLIPPPPPAPTGLVITNAGNQGQAPQLWWNAVADATSYRVFRRYASSPYLNIATTSVNSYLDTGAVLDSWSQFSLEYYATAVNTWGESGPSNTASALGYLQKGKPGIPDVYSLSPAYPNPFNPATTIRFGLPEDASARLVVYDLLGREVARLLERSLAAGYHSVVWNGINAAGAELPSGLYIARLLATPAAGTAPGFTQTIKMVLLK